MKTGSSLKKALKVIAIFFSSILGVVLLIVLLGLLMHCCLPYIMISTKFDGDGCRSSVKVYTNGRRSFMANVGTMFFRPGFHTIEVKKDGYRSSKINFEAVDYDQFDYEYIKIYCDKDTKTLKAEVVDARYPKTNVVIDANCKDIEMYVDGEMPLWTNYYRVVVFNTGNHTVEVKKDGYESAKIDIYINSFEQANNLELKISCNEEAKSLKIDIVEKEEPEEVK